MSRRTKQASVRRLRPSCSCMSDVQHAAQCGVNAFIPLKHVTARLQQYCAVCGQWVASHRCMKRHYQYSHKNLLEELGTEIQRLIHRTATACPTCHFCNVRCKDWRTHVQKCTVAWQCAILHLRERRRRAKPVLRDATLGTTGGTPTKAPPPITDSRPQRATKGPSIVDYSSSDTSSGWSTGGFSQARRTQHTTSSLPNSESVSGQATKQPYMDPGTHATQDRHGHCPLSGTACALGTHLPGRSTGGKDTGAGLVRLSHGLEIPAVEQHTEVSGGGHLTEASLGSNSGGPAAETDTDTVRRHSTPLQRHQETGGHGRSSPALLPVPSAPPPLSSSPPLLLPCLLPLPSSPSLPSSPAPPPCPSPPPCPPPPALLLLLLPCRPPPLPSSPALLPCPSPLPSSPALLPCPPPLPPLCPPPLPSSPALRPCPAALLPRPTPLPSSAALPALHKPWKLGQHYNNYWAIACKRETLRPSPIAKKIKEALRQS